MTTFEVHLTVIGPDDCIDLLAARLGGSVLDLDLDAFGRSTQITWHLGDEADLGRAQAQAIRSHVRDAHRTAHEVGVEVTRVKVEVDIGAAGTRTAVSAWDPVYFELHARVPCAAVEVERLRAIAGRLGARLSSAPRRSSHGTPTRYVNLRAPGTRGADDVGAAFDEVVAVLSDAGFPPQRVHRELVLADTNVGLDEAWLPLGGSVPR